MRLVVSSFVLLVSVGASARLSATTIVVFRTPTRIVMAGDSEASTIGASKTTDGGFCKIRPSGVWWLAMGGYARSADLDVYAAVAQAVAPTHTMAEALAAIDGMYPKIRDGLKSASTFALFAELFKIGAPVLSILIGGVDRTTGVLTVGYYNVDLKSRDPLVLAHASGTCPGVVCDDDGNLWFAASPSPSGPAIQLMMHTPRPAWLAHADASAARRLIALQIADTPNVVRAPIDVLEITASGAHWVNRDSASACRP